MDFDYTRHFLRGWILHFAGRNDSAYEAYAEAFSHDRNAFLPCSSLAFIAANRKDYRDAERWFREALRIRPESSDTWFNLAYVTEAVGDFEAAIPAFKESVRLSPRQDRAWYGMGMTFAKLGNHVEAANALSKATELQPMNGIAWYQLGMAYHHNNEREKMESVARHLSGFDPKFCRQLIRDSGRADLEQLAEHALP